MEIAGMLTVAAAINKAGVLFISTIFTCGDVRFVTSGQENDTINRISKQYFHQRQIRQVSIQHCRGSFRGLLNWMTGEFEWCTAIGDDSVSDPLGKGDVVRITWSEIGTGLGNTDNRLLLVGEFFHCRSALAQCQRSTYRSDRCSSIARHNIRPYLTYQLVSHTPETYHPQGC